MAKNPSYAEAIALLIEVAKTDTVYRDIYLGRATELLNPTLDELAYQSIRSAEKEIEELVRHTRSAVLQYDWDSAAEFAAKADQLRKKIDALAGSAVIAKEVYDADVVVFDPFSPGKHLDPQAQAMQIELRARLLDILGSLARLDSSRAAFYERRRGYFSGLELATSADSEKKSRRTRLQLEQLALQAAERGEVSALENLVKELRDYKDAEAGNTAAGTSTAKSRYECPVNLERPFPPDAIARARNLGLVQMQIPPLAEVRASVEVIYALAWDSPPSTPEAQREGVLRSEALLDLKTPAQFATDEFKILAGQFLRQVLINSGGARYLPSIAAEAALVEDFAETETADAPSKVLTALRLARRRGLARAEVDKALMRFGSQILADELNLDPTEYRLVCIPYDAYLRLGRDRNWGHWSHWTHFDGYQVMAGNRLRALVGGDERFGGVTDLVSISQTDARDGVYARFAVVRRARMVARWR